MQSRTLNASGNSEWNGSDLRWKARDDWDGVPRICRPNSAAASNQERETPFSPLVHPAYGRYVMYSVLDSSRHRLHWAIVLTFGFLRRR